MERQMPLNHAEMIPLLVRWGEAQADVRAMVLTSTRAIPNGQSDFLSDYDVILALRDVRPFHAERIWLEAFGPLLALFRDPLELEDGFLKSGYVVQYENGLKIDFSLWTVEKMQRVAAAPQLEPEFDAGYRVLLDKDHLTDALQPPTYQGYIPRPPTEAEYQETIEVFFVDAAYVAKYLWRDDLIAAKILLDYFLKQEHLVPVLVWLAEIERGWTVKPGQYGRGLKKWLRPDLWADLEATYTGPGSAENWAALDRSIALMRKVTMEIGQRMGYAYPADLDRRAVAYVQKIKNMQPGAESFDERITQGVKWSEAELSLSASFGYP